jgi:hypothetical protein
MRMQIQATDMPKFHVNQYLHLSRIDSGIDSLKAEMSGHEKAFWSLPMHLYDEEEGLSLEQHRTIFWSRAKRRRKKRRMTERMQKEKCRTAPGTW